MNDLTLKLKIEALVKGLGDVEKLAKEIKQTESASVGSISAVGKQLGETESAAYRFGVAVRESMNAAVIGAASAAALAGAAFVAMARSIVDADEKIYGLSQQTGLTAETLGELQYAAEQTNTSVDTLAKGVSFFNRVLFDAQKGGASAKLFAAVGLDPKSIGDTDEALQKLIGKISSIGDEATQSAVIQKFFGRGANEMREFFAQGEEGVRKLREEYRALGGVTTESARAANDFKDAMSSLRAVVESFEREAISPLIPKLTDLIRTLIEGKSVLGSFGKSLNGLIEAKVYGELDNIPKAMDAISDKITKLKAERDTLTEPTLANAINNSLFGDASTVQRQIDDAEKHLVYLDGLRKRELARQTADSATGAKSGGIDLSAFDRPIKTSSGAGRAAQDFSLQRLAVARAESEGELKIAQDTLQRMGKEWDYALDKNLVSYRAASQARINIQTAEIDATIAARAQELEAATRTAKDQSAPEGKRLDALAKVKALEADLIVLRQRRGDIAVTEGRKEADQEEALANKLRQVRNELDALKGGAGGEAIRATLEEQMKPVLEQLKAQGKLDDQSVVRQWIDAQGALADLQVIQSEFSRVMDAMSISQDRVQVQQKSGTLTETQARAELNKLYQETGTRIEEIIPKLEALAKASDMPEVTNALGRARNKLEEMKVSANDLSLQFRGVLGSAFSDFATQASSGAKSIGQAFGDAMNNLRTAILRIISDRLGQQLVDSILGPINGAGGSSGLLSGLSAALGRLFSGGAGAVSGQSFAAGHYGAIIGASTMSRYVSPMVFSGAPRMHSGGLLGGEVPFIGKAGEEVLTEDDPRHAKNFRGAGVTVNVIEAPGRGGQVNRSNDGAGLTIDVMVEQIENQVAKNIGRGNSPIFSALQAVSGLSRVPGTVR